ncbi:MAG: ISAzo13 family transposase [Cumulibacter sp.]
MKALPYESISRRYQRVAGSLDERTRRLWAGAEAAELGYGGVTAVARATGLTRKTVAKGQSEAIGGGQPPAGKRIRKSGGGRKSIAQASPAIVEALEKAVSPHTRGDPMRPLRWTCKSTGNLAAELRRQGFKVSAGTVGRMLKSGGYSLQSNRKRFEGRQNPDRDAQFEYIAAAAEAFHERGRPVISVDAWKKELVGNYRNPGAEWTPKGEALEVEAYDFIGEGGKAIPYGVYDTGRDEGWVSVGADRDTAGFAVRGISRWWEEMGERAYPQAREILVVADGGGSDGWRTRLWKVRLQEWADREGLKVMVCHLPPGASKWNKIERWMFCHITRNWRGVPLVSHEVVVSLIGATTTGAGLRIEAELDTGGYPASIKVGDAEMEALAIQRADFHGEWNYCFLPRNT